MLSIREVMVVEGIYDKKRLQEVVCSPIITTDGFDVFSNKAKQDLLRKIARERGLLILTDSDGAGFRIRNYIKNIVGDACVKHAYIPDVFGKERRKDKAGKEGKLGVEGILAGDLESILKKVATEVDFTPTITKTDLYELELLGHADSRAKREVICRKLGLPVRISTSSLVDMLNILTSYEEICQIIRNFPL